MLQVLQGLEPCARAANWCMVPCGILSLICHLLQACNCTVQVVRLNSRYHALSGSRTVPSGFDPCPLPWLRPLSTPSLLASCDSIFRFVSCGFSLLFLCLLFACGVEVSVTSRFTFPVCVALRFFDTARLSSIATVKGKKVSHHFISTCSRTNHPSSSILVGKRISRTDGNQMALLSLLSCP